MSQDQLQTYLEKIDQESFESYYSSLIQEARDRGKEDLFLLAQKILHYSEMEPTVHGPVCQFVQEEAREKLLLLPRGSFKSTIVTVAYVLQRILQNPDIRILIDSENFSNSTKFLSEIKNHIRYNEDFKQLYGDLYSDTKWTDSEIIVSTRTKNLKEPTIACAGVGVAKVGMHFDLIICDDLVSDKNVTSPELIQGVVDHWRLLYSILEPDGQIVVVGTRWDYGDLYGYILDATENEILDYQVMKRSAYEGNKLFFPQRLSKEFLDSQLALQGSYIFSCQYLNEPVDSDTATFRRKAAEKVYWDFSKDSAKDVLNNLQRPLRIMITVDPAAREKNTADQTVVLVCAVDHESNLYVLDYKLGRWSDPKFIIDAIYEEIEIWKHLTKSPIKVGIETVGFQNMLLYGFRDEPKFHEEKDRIMVRELKPHGASKMDRIRALQPRYENDALMWKKAHTELEDELYRFPKGTHDDIIDALAYQLQLLRETQEPEKIKPEQIKGTMAWHKARTVKPKSRYSRYNSTR